MLILAKVAESAETYITHLAPIQEAGKTAAIGSAAPAASAIDDDAALHTQAETGAVDIANVGDLSEAAEPARLELGSAHALVDRAVTAATETWGSKTRATEAVATGPLGLRGRCC